MRIADAALARPCGRVGSSLRELLGLRARIRSRLQLGGKRPFSNSTVSAALTLHGSTPPATGTRPNFPARQRSRKLPRLKAPLCLALACAVSGAVLRRRASLGGRASLLPMGSGPGRQVDAVAGCERPCATSAPQEPLPFGNASCPSPGRPVTLSAFGQLAPSEVRCQRHKNRCLSATLPAPAQAVLSPCRHSASSRRPKSAASATRTVAFRQRFLPQPRPSCHPVGIRPARRPKSDRLSGKFKVRHCRCRA